MSIIENKVLINPEICHYFQFVCILNKISGIYDVIFNDSQNRDHFPFGLNHWGRSRSYRFRQQPKRHDRIYVNSRMFLG